MITFACYSYLHSTYLLTKDFTNMTAVNIEMILYVVTIVLDYVMDVHKSGLAGKCK